MSIISAKINDAIVIASGWQPKISKIENSTLVAQETRPKTIHERVTICCLDSAINISNKSSLISELLHPANHIDYSDLNHHVKTVLSWCEENLVNQGQTIAVRASKIGVKIHDWSSRATEQGIGGGLFRTGWKIDLTNPDIILRVVAVNHEDSRNVVASKDSAALIWGVKISGSSTWDSRTAPKRPFFKPISLDPRLARSMANIACPKGGKLLDPFCGTGGILLEAAEVGLEVYGSDADSRMVEGSRDNLEWAEKTQGMSSNAKVKRCSATALNEHWKEIAPFDGFAFDPPYGRNSWKSDDGWQLFIDALVSCAEVATNKSRLTALLPLPPDALHLDLLSKDLNNPVCVTFGKQWNDVVEKIQEIGWKIETIATIPVHKSLSRLLIVCQIINDT
tara:strand:+ start:4962 stop:6143 length:1182 start_codon:yes stop_codon:yes gene_type:complete